ncbi:MAG: MOSC domain-containing protein [Elusimicrobia bacterium]|nr:MOSC domain-containing protein [Elusimicrobiota bacterium]
MADNKGASVLVPSAELRVPAGHPEGASVLAVCISPKKGIRKKNVGQAKFLENFGMEQDAHAGNWHRQVSLLAWESIEKMRAKGLNVNVGSFAENLTTQGIDLVSLPIGARLQVGSDVVLEVTQIGKECHTRCAIYYLAGDCVMPKEGIFARVIQEGVVKTGDEIAVLEMA